MDIRNVLVLTSNMICHLTLEKTKFKSVIL